MQLDGLRVESVLLSLKKRNFLNKFYLATLNILTILHLLDKYLIAYF